MLANILCTALPYIAPSPPDSELILSIRVLARAQQDAVRERQQTANKCAPCSTSTTHLPRRGQLRRPSHPGYRPTPAAAQKLRRASLRAALVRAGRWRNIDYQVDRILTGCAASSSPNCPWWNNCVPAHIRQI
jgi:hypothetical protein